MGHLQMYSFCSRPYCCLPVILDIIFLSDWRSDCIANCHCRIEPHSVEYIHFRMLDEFSTPNRD